MLLETSKFYLYNIMVLNKEENKLTFIENIKEKAKKDIKTIILPEAEDIRVLRATEQIIKKKDLQKLF